MQARERWSSKMIFIFAAVGSAVGLGNVWRFPYLAAKYGGGAFLVPYLIMLAVIGVPLLIMEFAIGQRMQLGAIGSFKQIRPRLLGVGTMAVLCGFVVVSYYAVVMAWCILYFFYSFDMAWGADPQVFFFDNVLHVSGSAEQLGFISPPILFALMAAWIMIYFSVWKGVRSVGRVVLVTMPLPILLLGVLFVRAITLPGAMDGITLYLTPDFAALGDWEVWSAAMSQIFFTLSLAFGIMIAYASYQHERSDIAKSAITTSLTNSAISIFAGFVVFATLGYMAQQSGTDVAELAKSSGVSLAFIVFPKALSLIPAAPVFAALFFVMLITLAIDSAFSLVEAAATVIHDKYANLRKEDISLYVCVFGFSCGVIFTTASGIRYLDIADHFITHYGLVLAGLLEVFAVGYGYGAENLRTYINEVSDIKLGKWWTFFIKYLIPLGLLLLLFFSFKTDLAKPYEDYPGWARFAFGWLILIIIAFVSFLTVILTRPAAPPEPH